MPERPWIQPLALLASCLPAVAQAPEPLGPVHYEHDGVVVVEAEAFATQSADQVRRWYVVHHDNDVPDDERTAADALPTPDGDYYHARYAVDSAYVEILPDTRRTDADLLLTGTNFSNAPGVMAILSYPVHFSTAGRYYVWVRAHHTGSEDNGVHVGLDGDWPESGRRMQWCLRRQWIWGSAQRTAADHCGESGLIWLDVQSPGLHTVQFSMREDGFEMDRWMLTIDPELPSPGVFTGPDAAPYREPPPGTAVEPDSWGALKQSR